MTPNPESRIEALCAQVRRAAASGTLLHIRGGGSKDFYGQPSQGELLSTADLQGILSYEPSELVVTALAGTPLAELEAALAAQGQCLAFEPPHFAGGATVGGAVASGLSGPARASVGALRDYVLGVKFINGRAEHLTFGGQVIKNVAGYDVSRLMAGSLGTLGVLTEVSLKVLPVAPLEATLKFEMGQAQALMQLNTWGGQPLPLNASCWIQENGLGVLYLRLRGAVAAVEAACKSLGAEQLDPALAAPLWQSLRNQQHDWFAARAPSRDLWRLSVPQTALPLDLPEATLIEWHGGQRWLQVAPEREAAVRSAARGAGGSATLFIAAAAGNHWAGGRFDPLTEPLAKIHQGLKREFDPAGVFNRARLYPEF